MLLAHQPSVTPIPPQPQSILTATPQDKLPRVSVGADTNSTTTTISNSGGTSGGSVTKKASRPTSDGSHRGRGRQSHSQPQSNSNSQTFNMPHGVGVQLQKMPLSLPVNQQQLLQAQKQDLAQQIQPVMQSQQHSAMLDTGGLVLAQDSVSNTPNLSYNNW